MFRVVFPIKKATSFLMCFCLHLLILSLFANKNYAFTKYYKKTCDVFCDLKRYFTTLINIGVEKKIQRALNPNGPHFSCKFYCHNES